MAINRSVRVMSDMFGKPVNKNLEAAEEALDRGAIDAAFDLVGPPAYRGDLPASNPDRRARRFLSRLGDALMRRGQDHLLARRFVEALKDFDRAGRCGHPSEQVEEWRVRATQAGREHDELEARQRLAIEGAHRRLAQGSLVGAAEARAQAPMEDARVAALSQAIAGQNERARAALAAVGPALEEGDFVRAVQQIRKARALHSKIEGLVETETMVFERLVREARDDFAAGRLAQARQHMQTLSDIGRGRAERVELDEALRLAAAAATALATGAHAQAGILAGRLARAGVDAAWIEETREQLAALERFRQSLLEGPLGTLIECDPAATTRRHEHRGPTPPAAWEARIADARPGDHANHGAGTPTRDPSAPREPDRAVTNAVPRRLLLRIDGVGSFLILRGTRIGIGRAGSRNTDLELLSDLSERQAEIIRAEEDYFIVSSQGVQLAGQPVSHALLQDGDRIQLGGRARLTFRRPSLKSTTAALDLGEGVRAAAGDCRRVILWDGPILIGNTRECHILAPQRTGGLLLIERAGELFAMPVGRAQDAVHVPLGAVADVGDLRIGATVYHGAAGIGRVIG